MRSRRPIIRRPAARLRATAGVVPVSALVGVVAGLLAAAFHGLVVLLTTAFTGHGEFIAGDADQHPLLPALGPWFLLLAPVASGLLYGPILHRFAPGPLGQGTSEVGVAVHALRGRLPRRTIGARVSAAAVCLAGGGSVGRVGPIVELGACAATVLTHDRHRREIVVAAGAAGGFAGILGAPIAAPFFVVEVLSRRYTLPSFAATMTAAVAADAVVASLSARPADFELARLDEFGWHAYPVAAAIGLLSGGVGWVFARTLLRVRATCDGAWRGPQWIRPAVGGLLLGGLLVWLPQLYGVGDPVVHDVLDGHYLATFLALLVLMKIVATSLTFGIGGYGGVFGPLLFLGATSGTAVGQIVAAGGLAGDTPVWYFGVLGIAAVLATGARAPLTGVVLALELAGTAQPAPAVLIAAAAATLIGALLSTPLHRQHEP